MKNPHRLIPASRVGKAISSLKMCAVSAIALLIASGAFATQRSITEFLSRQATYCVVLDSSGNVVCPSPGVGCITYVPLIPNFVDWTDPVDNTSVTFDYAGLANSALGNRFGTTVTGTINEVLLKDGSVNTTIILHTKDAMVFAHNGIGQTLPGTAPLIFGSRPADILAGAPAALGDSTLKIVLHGNAPNQPLPDFMEVAFCGSPIWSLSSVSFSGTADGTLPDGTPAHLKVSEVGLISEFVKQAFVLGVPSRVALDAFPAENISIQSVGN